MELLQIKMLNTAVERILNQELSSLGLTYTQSTVIGYLIKNQDHDVYQRDIEYNLGLTHSTVSSILGRMEASGLIYAKTELSDRRYKKILLTDKARRYAEQIGTIYKTFKKKLYNEIDSEQRTAVNTAIKKMLNNIQ